MRSRQSCVCLGGERPQSALVAMKKAREAPAWSPQPPEEARTSCEQRVLGFPLEDVDKLAAWGSAQVMQYVYGKGHMNILGEEETAHTVNDSVLLADVVKATEFYAVLPALMTTWLPRT